MPRTPRNDDGSNKSPVPLSKKEERYLACSICEMSTVLMLAPEEARPMHRCQPVYRPMSFDTDLPASKAPKSKPWFVEKEKHPRPGGTDRRPKIVL